MTAYRSAARGITLVEIIIAMGVLLVALVGLVGALMTAQSSTQSTRERTLAMNAARDMLEEMRSRTFLDVYRLYNSNPADDPGGPSTGPGDVFTVDGLNPIQGQPVGRIQFPEASGVPALREDVTDPDLGMPFDLDADGAVDADDHSADYRILPVRIVIRWRGMSTEERFETTSRLYDR